MKFKDKIKAKEYRQAKEAVKECLKREWKRSEGEGWITERTYRVRRNKKEKLQPSFAFLTPYPTLLNPQPFIPAPTLPHSIQFTLHHTDPSSSSSSSSPFTFHQPQTAFTQPPPPSSSHSSQSAEVKAEGGGKEGGREMRVKADLSHDISSDTSSHSLHLSSEISSQEGHQFSQEVRLTTEISPSDLDLPKPDIESNIVDQSKQNIIDHDHHHHHHHHQDEELTWDAVRILVEADGTSFYGLGEIAGSLSLNDLCELSVDDLDLDNEDDLAKNPGDGSDDPYYHPAQSEHENPSPYKQRRSRRNKKGITICWNSDVGLYSHLNPSLYQSHPFLISLLRDGSTNAYYLDSTYLSIVHLSKIRLSDTIDINSLSDDSQPLPYHPKDKEGGKEYYQIIFISRSSNSPPLYIMQAKSPQEIAQEITRLFGSISLPPKWAIGYQQCRYSYYPDSRVVSIAESFRRYSIPCDVIWMDIHYMNEYRCFQFSSKHFPDPPSLSNKLHSIGFHGVWMIDPGIKVDDQYEVFKSGLRGDHFILKHSAKEALSLEISEEESLALPHLDEPPSLEEYPEIKEAENIIDITEEPGFNRRPDLDDQDYDYYPPSPSPLQTPSPKPRHLMKGRSPRSSRSSSRSPRVRRPDPTALPSHPLSRNPLSSYGDYISPAITSGEGEAGVGRGESVLVEPLIGSERGGIGYDDDDDGLFDDDDEYWEEEYEEKVVIRPKRMRKVEELEIRKVWPGDCVFPDFTRRETRKWWGALYSSFLVKNGIDGIWNDMNEVAAFGEGGTINRKCWHRADRELGGGDDHSRYHNVYGFLMTLATKQGMKHARKDKREFVLTRANFMGGHRHAATWTGDNTSNWDHLGWTIPMILNLSLSGQLFCGVDIGGFFGDATPELFARWMGFGTLLPFARAHSCVRTRNHEPWSFGAEVKRICKKAIERRYRLLGYYYTLFYEGSQVTSLPILQPLFYQNPSDQRLRDVDSLFTIGNSILVVTDLNPPSPHPTPSSTSTSTTTTIPSSSSSSSDQAMTDEERFVRRLAQERRKEEDRIREEKRKEMITNANPMTDDEDMVVEDEHVEEETQEEEEERKRYLEGRKENDRFPSDILARSDWIRFHVLDDFSDQFETELPEMYMKKGSIIPLISLSQHVLPAPQYFLLPLSLSFSFPSPPPSQPSSSSQSTLLVAEGNLYEDEGDSFDYQTLQSYSYVKFRIERSSSSFSHPPPSSDLRHSRSELDEITVTTTHLHLADDPNQQKEVKDEVEDDEEEEEKIVVYLIHLSNSNAFYPDREIYVTEIRSDNAHHPTPLFHFHQHQFQESFHPAYANHKVYSYVHLLKKPSLGYIL